MLLWEGVCFMATTDLNISTRELFVRSLVDQVFFRTPVVDELQRRRQITFKGGRFIERLVDTDEIDDLMQEYDTNTALTDEKKTTLQKPRFLWKKGQLPLRYDVDEEIQNVHAGSEEQLLDTVAHLAKKGLRGVKLWLQRKMYNEGSDTPVTDGGTQFQSLVSALNHDTPYGTISRSFSAGTNDFWQGADPSDISENVTTSTQDDAQNLTLSNMRKWVNQTSVAHHMENEDDLLYVMPPVLFDKFLNQTEAKVDYKQGDPQKQGIRSATWDGHRVVSDPFLQRASNTKTWVFILNMRFWELRISAQRNFKMTDFKWQGEQSNGFDFWLARILVAGNFVCWKPNSSIWLSNVS